MKKILVLSESLRINATSSGIVSSTFIKLLSEAGYELQVLTPNDSGQKISWLPQNIEIKEFSVVHRREAFIDHIPKIRALPTYWKGFDKKMKAVIDGFKYEILMALKDNKFDFIYALGSGSEFAPHFALADLDLNIPFWVNIHDPYPMHVYPKPYQQKKDYLNGLREKKFKAVLRKAKGISFPSHLLMQHMAKTFPVVSEKGFVIPHIGTALSRLSVIEGEEKITFLPDKINILHAGTLLGPRNPKYLLTAIAELNATEKGFKENVYFTFIGKVNKALRDIIAEENLDNVRFLTIRTSYKNSMALLRQADAALVIEAISDFSPFLPGKVADIAFLKKPIIDLSPKHAEVRRLLGEEYPYQSELDDVPNIKLVLKAFYNDALAGNLPMKAIEKIKDYVSIERNIGILTSEIG